MVKQDGAAIQAAARALRAAPRVLVTTGAGMSRDSGIPTFRDAAGGLWARYDPEELATEAAFRRHPARVFGWYAWRRRLVRGRWRRRAGRCWWWGRRGWCNRPLSFLL